MKVATIVSVLLTYLPLDVHAQLSLPSFRGLRKSSLLVGSGKHHEDPDSHHTNDHHFVRAVIEIDHLSGDKTDWHDEVIVNTLLTSYNKISGPDQPHLDNGFIANSIEVPDEDSLTETLKLGGFGAVSNPIWYHGWWWLYLDITSCVWCFDDDRYVADTEENELFLVGSGGHYNPHMHEALEAELCNELKETGTAALSDIQYCKIEFSQFTEADVPALQLAQEKATKKHPKIFTSQLHIQHVLSSEFSDDDKQLLSHLFLEAYNTIHLDADYTLTSVGVVNHVDIPYEVDEDDKKETTKVERVTFFSVEYECQECKTGNLLPPVHGKSHEAFEALVCVWLRNGKMSAYSHAEGCDITFGVPPGAVVAESNN